MKVTLTFDLPEEKDELFQALHGADWEYVIWQLDEEFLRKEIKYNDKPYQPVRDRLYQILGQLGLEFSP